MYCGKCGNQVKEGSGFCEKCGTKIEEKDIEKKKNNKSLIIIVAIVVIAVGGIVAIGKSDNSTSEQEVVSQNVNDLENESQQKINREENTEKKEETKKVVKCVIVEYPRWGEEKQTEYNELGDVILEASISNGNITTSRYRWEYIGNLRKAYSDDGKLAQEIEQDQNGNRIAIKIYDKDNRVIVEYAYEYDDLGKVKKSSYYSYGYEDYESEGYISKFEFYCEYGEYENVVADHSVSYGRGRKDVGEPWIEYRYDTYTEYNEYGEIISQKYVSDRIEKNTIYKYQRSEDGKNSVGRAYVYDGKNQELIEEYDEYEYEYDENKNMISKCIYTTEGEIETRWYQEYNENGNLVAIYQYSGENLYSVTNYTYYE